MSGFGEWMPGVRVRAPDHPDWGEGQVQSALPQVVVVMFAEQGRVVIRDGLVRLEALD